MEKRVLNFAEFKAKTLAEKLENSEELSSIDEGFLDSVLRFFKGIFDLFNDKKVKKEAEDSSLYFTKLENDYDIDDEDLEDKIDVKKVRKSATRIQTATKERISADAKKGITTSKDLVKVLSSWFGMVLVQEDALRMPLLEKLLKNPDLSKRFVWVPSKYTGEKPEKPIKDWYKQSECILDKKISTALTKLIKLPADKKKEGVTAFITSYINFEVSKAKKQKSYKEEDNAYLNELFLGFAAMINSVVSTMSTVITNTPDPKLSETIASEIIQKRTRKRAEKKTDTKEDKTKTSTTKTTKTKSEKPSEKASTGNKEDIDSYLDKSEKEAEKNSKN